MSPRRSPSIFAATILAVLACGAPTPPADAASELIALGQGAVMVSAEQGKDTADAYMTILNTGTAPVPIQVSFQAANSESVKAILVSPKSVQPGKAARVKVSFSGLKTLEEPASGQLVVEGGSKPVAQAATITPALQPLVDWPPVIVGVSLGLAAVLMGTIAMRLLEMDRVERSKLLGGRVPGPKWSFESWATHLVAAGALFGTVLGTASLPKVPMQIDKESLVALNLLFAGIAAVAPFVFQALRRPTANAADEEAGNWGFTWALLISCGLTLGAVFGELASLGLATWVITGGGAGGILLEVALGAVVVLVAYYVATTTWSLASTDWGAVASKVEPAVSGRAHVRRVLAELPNQRVSGHVDVGPDAAGAPITWRVP